MNVTLEADPHAVTERLLDAAVEVGFERTDDFNGERQAGAGYYHTTVEDGRRHSAAAAYVKPVLDRPNLTVETRAHVTGISFDGGRAVGVQYERNGRRYDVETEPDGEVLLSAGAIQSPQLLMLSGVGPAEHLAEHDVGVEVDLPGVGRNLRDHLRVSVIYESAAPIERAAGSNSVVAGGFERSDPDLPAPDVQYSMAEGVGADRAGDGFTVSAFLLRPESRGRLALRSADPYDNPVIDPRYLTVETDVETLAYGIERAREIAGIDALDDLRGGELRPGADVRTDAEIEAFVRETADTSYHPVGTCKMGDDELAVVDDRLRVRGLEGLRVVDASVMPTITGGNTNAPTVAIAERAADLVIDDR